MPLFLGETQFDNEREHGVFIVDLPEFNADFQRYNNLPEEPFSLKNNLRFEPYYRHCLISESNDVP